MSIKRVLITIFLSLSIVFGLVAEELPKPTYDNSIMFSWTHDFSADDQSEMDYVKSQFGNGLYAPLMFSKFYSIAMDWKVNPASSSSNIAAFKAKVDSLTAYAKQNGIGLHFTLNYGMARVVTYYNDAKIEDIRNAQWYNDNNISSSSQQRSGTDSAQWKAELHGFDQFSLDHTGQESLSTPLASTSVINKYVFTTLSRYARKLRAHLSGKVSAGFAYLKQVQDANPTVHIVVSAPGESELNSLRLNAGPIQDYFCDYSPFAVMEFRDWITHEGLYAPGQPYDGQGYSGGGSKYQGSSGLSKFNSDFGTSFSTWNLKYYNWSLSDAVDTNYTDSSNPDPNIIPVSQYVYNGMKPSSGGNYISNGFDPPRTMVTLGTNAYFDLWFSFREHLVYHYVKDMTDLARASGFNKEKYYTHQIPGDYLFGTRPNDPAIPTLNNRYYSSASPMWTADQYSDNGMGITLYDIKYPTWFARTSLYGIDGASSMSDNWAALEYHPEVIPIGVGSTISDVATIYNQMVRLYNGAPHVISFFKWVDSTDETSEYRYKGNNRETAAKQFFTAIRDIARQPMGTVFTPKQVEGFTGYYGAGAVNLSWSEKIWSDLAYEWSHWGNFKEFAVYRGYTSDFTADSSSKITSTTSNSFKDYGMTYGTTVYYKIAAINTNGSVGPIQTISVTVAEGQPTPILSVSRSRINFGYIIGSSNPPGQTFRISNTGAGALNWTASKTQTWLSCSPATGINGAEVTVSVDGSGLAAGTYSDTITVADPAATDSPQTISVYLTVKNASQSAAPFGSFDTPVEGSTVRSSIPVTGWVLDDVGVEYVKLYRDPVSSNESSGLIYIGDAVFVEGARTDVEASYPDYPASDKAGWGYMMLTNFLPGGGNGTFTLHAIATDTSGLQTTLGSKTIIIDNNSAVKPFGAIDTPAQGGNASGSSFLNWGWVLTPQPSQIPTDGSTINVWVDGVKLGNPTYNIYRSDIATLFPTYANSDGAVGYFYLDTTAYADGVHTIQWHAQDNGGNKDGIGSRYFTIQNSGGDLLPGTAETKSSSVTKMINTYRIPKFSATQLESAKNAVLHPVSVLKGFQEDSEMDFQSNVHYCDTKGTITVSIHELQRVVIKPVGKRTSSGWLAMGIVGDEIRELPVGSTFDPTTSTLYWQPGHGFLGEHIIQFVQPAGVDNGLKLKRIQVKVKILPGKEK